ncbi:sigma factor [Alicyclobacillus sp. ALC3]|uniref:sigma factor n=1 Tax=Alicyclobacillus sp. ALC3 TaxID=2796143 RepID=UPI003FCE9D52
MDEYEKKLIAIAYSILHDEQLALDCVQEGFMGRVVKPLALGMGRMSKVAE